MAAAFSVSVKAQTLIAHYDFTNAASTGVATDPVNGLNGIVDPSCTAAAGKCGQPNTALKLNGFSSFVRVPGNPLLNLDRWTIQAVVFVDAFETSQECQVTKILQHGSQYGVDYYALEINDNNDDITTGELNGCFSPVDTNHMRFYGAAAGSIMVGAPSHNVHTGQWYCLTASYGSGVMRYYVNGALTYTRAWPYAYNYAGSMADLLIGTGTGQGGTTYWFNGKIDDIVIYDDEMSAAQIADLCFECPRGCIMDIGYCSQLSTPFAYTFTATTATPYCIEWNFGDGTGTFISAPGASITHTFPSVGGSYQICARAFDCKTHQYCNEEKCFTMCMNKVSGAKPAGGANDDRDGAVKSINRDQQVGMLYPNPADAVLNIPLAGFDGPVTINVTTIDGKQLLSRDSKVSGKDQVLQLNTSELRAGTYLLEVVSGSRKVTRQFTKL